MEVLHQRHLPYAGLWVTLPLHRHGTPLRGHFGAEAELLPDAISTLLSTKTQAAVNRSSPQAALGARLHVRAFRPMERIINSYLRLFYSARHPLIATKWAFVAIERQMRTCGVNSPRFGSQCENGKPKHGLAAVFTFPVKHEPKGTDMIRICKRRWKIINSRGTTRGEGAHANINKHSSSVSEASCFI